MVRVRYTSVLLGPWFIIAGLVIMAATAMFVVASAIPGAIPGLRPGRPPLLFIVLWLGIFAWNAYIWLYRFAWRLELDEEVLKWWAPIHRGEIVASTIRSVGPHPLSQQVSVITSESSPRVYTLTLSGFTRFAQELLKAAPDARYRENSYANRRAKRTRQWASEFRKID